MKNTAINVIELVMLIFIILIISYCVNMIVKDVSTKENNVKSEIGNIVIIGKDTSVIVDYSMLNNNYTLSNGKKVSFEYVKNKTK